MNPAIQLIDAGADLQTRRLAGLLAEAFGGGAPDAIRAIGRGGNLRHPLAAMLWIDAHARGRTLHAWGTAALLGAALSKNQTLVYSPPAQLTRPGFLWLRRIAKRRDIAIATSTPESRSQIIGGGIEPAMVHSISPGLVGFPPPIDIAARRRMGFAADDFVILAPGESTRTAAHLLALWASSLLHELDPTWKFLISGRGPMARSLAETTRRLHHPQLLYWAPELEFEQLLHSADAALITAQPTAPPYATALCMAAGLPIVATKNVLFSDRRNALVIEGQSPRELAQRLIEIRADLGLRESLARAAQTDAARLFERDQFLDHYAEIYRAAGGVAPARGSMFSRAILPFR